MLYNRTEHGQGFFICKIECCLSDSWIYAQSIVVLVTFLINKRKILDKNRLDLKFIDSNQISIQPIHLLCIHIFQKRLSGRTANGNCRTEIIRPKGTVGSEY